MGETLPLVLTMIDATVRVATPLVLAALAGLFSELAGVVDVGLEGKMLGAAFFAAAVASVTGSPWLGLLAAIAAATTLAMVHGLACITFNGNQVVSGMALNILMAGLAPTLAFAWFREGGQTPLLGPGQRFAAIALPFADALAQVPVLGEIYGRISGHNVLVYMAALSVPVVAFVIYRTRFGLRVRAVGENPSAVDTAGIPVGALRYRALLCNGVLCGIAGAYLSTAHGAAFVRDMTAGKGYLALAALIFGKWKPVPTLFACLLFAFTDALKARLQGVSVPGIGQVPVQAIQAMPYVLTVLLLAGFVGRAMAPKAIGVPYVKER